MDKPFETEVLTRLAKIETKLDDYKTIKEHAVNASHRSNQNEKRIEKLENNQKWIVLLILGAVLSAILRLVII